MQTGSRTFTPAEILRLVNQYNQGVSIARLAANRDVSALTVRRALVQGGATIRTRGRYTRASSGLKLALAGSN